MRIARQHDLLDRKGRGERTGYFLAHRRTRIGVHNDGQRLAEGERCDQRGGRVGEPARNDDVLQRRNQHAAAVRIAEFAGEQTVEHFL